jgi:hypothetical protein
MVNLHLFMRAAASIAIFEAMLIGCASLTMEPTSIPQIPQVEEALPTGDCGWWDDYEACRT